MQETGNKKEISVRIGLRGFSYSIDSCAQSDWLGADCVFNVPEFNQKYDEVRISLFTPKFTLVPATVFDGTDMRELLARAVTLDEGDEVESVEIPQHGAVAIYSNSTGSRLPRIFAGMFTTEDSDVPVILPEQYWLIMDMEKIRDYNKIVASYCDGRLYLAVAQGRSLLLCSSYEAPDFTSAQYYIFYAMKHFQLNPEVSTVYFRTPLSQENELSLYSYFRSVGSL